MWVISLLNMRSMMHARVTGQGQRCQQCPSARMNAQVLPIYPRQSGGEICRNEQNTQTEFGWLIPSKIRLLNNYHWCSNWPCPLWFRRADTFPRTSMDRSPPRAPLAAAQYRRWPDAEYRFCWDVSRREMSAHAHAVRRMRNLCYCKV